MNERLEAPLTENERTLALVVAEREGGETRKWLNLVLGAYDALQARLTACEQRRGDLDLVVMKRGMEIDRLRAALYTCEQSLIVVRDNSAEARVSTLKAALEKIAANHVPTTYGGGVYAFVQFARSALAALQEETP